MVTRTRKDEQEAIRTTIVGGRPPGCGQPVGEIPYGIEVLVKKASVDDEFRKLLLADRERAALEIGLELNPSEVMMLRAVSDEQLAGIIDHVEVRPDVKPALMGKVAAVMIAALGFSITGCGDTPPMCGGIRPPDKNELTDEAEVKGKIEIPADVSIDAVSRGIRPDHPVLLKIEDSVNDAIIQQKKKLTEETAAPELTGETLNGTLNNLNNTLQQELQDRFGNFETQSRGIRPDRPVSKGIQPDRPVIIPDKDDK